MSTAPRADTPSFPACLPDTFYQHILNHNPFILNRAEADADETGDSPIVHASIFSQLTELASQAIRLRRGPGVLLTGETGVGKSHLLGRLGRWAKEDKQRAFFVSVRGLQMAPEQLSVAVLRSTAMALSARQPGEAIVKTPLYRLAHAAVKSEIGKDRGSLPWDQIGRSFARLANRLAPSARRMPAGRTAFDLLFRFFRSASRAALGKETGGVAELVLRYLTGGALEPDKARWLKLYPSRHRDEPVMLADPEQAQQILAALITLVTASGQPFILAVDQAEELDAARFVVLARFLEWLLDSVPGLLVVTATDPTTLQSWRHRCELPGATWDRLGQFTIAIPRLQPEEGQALIKQRLDDALTPFNDLEFLYRLRVEAPLFPLHLELNADGVRAREAIDAARMAWTAEQELLKQESGAVWLAGWAERLASAQENADLTLIREEIQASVDASADESVNLGVEEDTTEGILSFTPDQLLGAMARSVEIPVRAEDAISSLTPEQLCAAIADKTPPVTPKVPEEERGEASLSIHQLQAAAAWHGDQPDEPSEMKEEADSSFPVEPANEVMVDATEQKESPDEAVLPPAVAAPSAHTPLEQAVISVPEIEFSPVAHDLGHSIDGPKHITSLHEIEFPPIVEAAVFSEPPTVPDPDAVRQRSRPTEEPSVPIDSEMPLALPAIAPSARLKMLAPRRCPQTTTTPATPTEEAIDSAIEAAIAAYLAIRLPQQELPADAEQIAELILNLLQQCRTADPEYGILQAERTPPWKATLPACDLIMRQATENDVTLRTGVLVLTASRITAIASFLRRLTSETQPFDRLFLITEESIGLPLGPRGTEYLQELQQRTSVQLQTLELTTIEYAELSALRASVRQARNGTLLIDNRRLTEAEAISSHHRRQRYKTSRFLSALLFDRPLQGELMD